MLRIHEVKLQLEQDKSQIPQKIMNMINMKELKIDSYKIVKESIDARDKNNIYFIYSVDFTTKNEKAVLEKKKKLKIDVVKKIDSKFVASGTERLRGRPIVVGFGPCGIFCALILAEMGYKPIVIERGKEISERAKDVADFWKEGKLNPKSNVQFGEGGAGAFSDGKLTTRIKDKRVEKVLQGLVDAGAGENILYEQKPHIGTDVLREVVTNLRKRIIDLGGDVRFETQFVGFEHENLVIEHKGNKSQLESDVIILAIGHSARDTFYLLDEIGMGMEQKPFSIGVRIEHPQQFINNTQYGEFAKNKKLGAAEYKISHHCENGRGVYSFCMCPGGYVIAAASEPGALVTNGMSFSNRGSENANSALLVDVLKEDFESSHPLAGVEFQRKWEKLAFETGGENYHAPAQLVSDFLKKRESTREGSVKPSYMPGVIFTDLRKCLPKFAADCLFEALPELAKKMPGFAYGDAVMTGVETRSSSPVRILRDENFQSNISCFFPAGEGAGYAGGIVSAAVDGIKVAEAIAKKFAPIK
ncbi:MAG: hypothetical protein WCF96_02115 [Eubacteriales bacterium]